MIQNIVSTVNYSYAQTLSSFAHMIFIIKKNVTTRTCTWE